MTENVRRYWEDHARPFDALYEEGRAPMRLFNRVFRRALRERLERALAEVRARPGCTVLDVGCGSGRGSVAMAVAGAQRVVGVDFSRPMLDLARGLARERGVEARCTFVEADFLAFQPDATFDVVVALGVFDYLAEPVPFLARMRGMARGTVVFSAPRPGIRARQRAWRYGRRGCPVYFHDAASLRRIAAEAGLQRVQVFPLQGGFLVRAEPSA